MKALLLKEKNQWKNMKVEETRLPSIQEDEILVEVHAAGLNPVDYKTAANGNPNWTYPHILGLDVAGTVADPGNSRFKKGDRVVYHGDLTKKGGYAEFAAAKADAVSLIPDRISFEEAAALPTAGYTAYQALHRKLPFDQISTILIHAGAGGVGGFAIQLAKLAGKTVFTTASSHNHEYVKSLGADYVLDYREKDVKEEILKLTNGKGVDAVLDTVSRQNATHSLDMLAFMGHIAYIAGAPDFTKIPGFTKVVSYHEVALAAAYTANDKDAVKDLSVIGSDMLRLCAEGKLDPMIAETITLDEVPEALIRLSDRHVKGKIIAKIKS